MSTLIVHRNGTNGAKPCGPPARVLPLLGAQIDRLLELRRLLREAQAAEREETAAIINALVAAGGDSAQGRQAVASLEHRVSLEPDVELFIEALGPAAYPALSVRVEAARRLMPADLLEAISESSTVAVLRLEPVSPAPAR